MIPPGRSWQRRSYARQRQGGPWMTTKTPREVPAGMQRVYRRFERWRSSHRGRLQIPAGLRASAAEVAREHGVFQTAKVLRLEYAKLKRMVASAPRNVRAAATPAIFLNWCHRRQSVYRSASLSWKGRVARYAFSGKGLWHRTWPD